MCACSPVFIYMVYLIPYFENLRAISWEQEINDLQNKTKVLWQNRVGKLHVLLLPILQVFFAPQILISATPPNTFSTAHPNKLIPSNAEV